MTTAATPARVTLDRRVPPFGGFTLTYLGIELKRKLRNRRTLIFTIAFPVLMYIIIGLPLRDEPLMGTPVSQGGVSVAAYIMVSMAMYGAMMSATQTGAAVGVERAQGWSRQLRLTPLNPLVNVVIKMIAGMMLGLLAIVATYIAGAISGIQLSPFQWIVTGLAAWLLAGAVFTTLGLMVGYMVPGENAAQITSLAIVLLVLPRRPVLPGQLDAGLHADDRLVHPGLRHQPDRPRSAHRAGRRRALVRERPRLARDLRRRHRMGLPSRHEARMTDAAPRPCEPLQGFARPSAALG